MQCLLSRVRVTEYRFIQTFEKGTSQPRGNGVGTSVGENRDYKLSSDMMILPLQLEEKTPS